jgi:hypothetical protein
VAWNGYLCIGRVSSLYFNIFIDGFEEITIEEVVLVEGQALFQMFTHIAVDDTQSV